ncbi:MAG TPA: hypothetical protein VGM88_17015 [Kofleriaceae bacterium]
MAAVLVHIDLDGDRPHASSLQALAAGREVASSWGGTLYAALVVHHPHAKAAKSTSEAITAQHVPEVEAARAALARAGADKIVVTLSESPVAPLWAAQGGAWQGVLDQLRPRLVLFGADAPSAPELGPRTGARIGARLLVRARVFGGEELELRDRDGGSARPGDGGATVALVGTGSVAAAGGDDDIDVMVVPAAEPADARVALLSSAPAPAAQSTGVIIALGDDAADDGDAVRGAVRLAGVIDARIVGTAAVARVGAVGPDASIERYAPLAPELCIAVGQVAIDLAGSATLVRIGATSGKGVDAAISGAPGAGLAALARALEREP